VLIVLAVLAATQALGTTLSVLSFEKVYLKTTASKYEILGKSLIRKIEQSLALGKRLDHFVGMDRLVAPLYDQLPDLDEIFIADGGGKLLFGSKTSLPTLRPHPGRTHIMLPIRAASGEEGATLGMVFNRSAIETRKRELLHSARLELTVSLLLAAILIGLLTHYRLLKPADRHMRILSDRLFQDEPHMLPNHARTPQELMEIHSSIAACVDRVHAFRRETAAMVDRLSTAAAEGSTTAAQIGEMKRILMRGGK
jgi:hypothetical protein